MPDATTKGPVVSAKRRGAPSEGETYVLFIEGDTRKPVGWMNYGNDVSEGMDPWRSYGPTHTKEMIFCVAYSYDGRRIGWSYMPPDPTLHPAVK